VNRCYLIPKFVSSKLGFNLNLRYLNVRIVKYITPLVNYQFFKMLRNFAVILRGFEVKFSTNAHKISDIPPNEDFKTRLLKVAVIGIPNVGKSTFINNLMDRKVFWYIFCGKLINRILLGLSNLVKSSHNKSKMPGNFHRRGFPNRFS
jgi:ribosome biogenesis GTPase A